MEKIVEQGLLYDFYGELLTKHQRDVYQDVIYNDYSLSEIAQEYGISRQGVHDLVKRCDAALLEYEEKLKLVQKFLNIKDKVSKIHEMTQDDTSIREEAMDKISVLSQEILEEL